MRAKGKEREKTCKSNKLSLIAKKPDTHSCSHSTQAETERQRKRERDRYRTIQYI